MAATRWATPDALVVMCRCAAPWHQVVDLSLHSKSLVILDEVQHMPEVFPVLRSLIDEGRRAGQTAGRFLLLGSATGELLRQSGESLDWRQNLISTYLERELPSYGSRLPAQTLRRLWTMLAHLQGGLLDVSQLAKGLLMDAKTVQRYLDMLCDLMLLRKLLPWHSNLGKRLVKSPKVYVRDSGLLHALLGLASHDALLAHPVVGNSWEGFAIEPKISISQFQAGDWRRI
jgi:predicted AAA+ superfamily ATPase